MDGSIFTDRLNKSRRYHLTMFGLGVVIIAVAVATIFGTDSATSITKSKAAVRPAANNNVDNPSIDLPCENPILTVALQLDRSGSVWNDSNGKAPAEYKKNVNDFIEKLYSEISSREGRIEVLLYAFGSRSVNQNDSITVSTGRELITTVDSNDSLEDMKRAVDNIYFSNNARGKLPGPGVEPREVSIAASNSAYDLARGYNAPGPASDGFYGYTNWDDALLELAKVGASPKYSEGSNGRKIDLALFLTDGHPNVHNQGDRSFGTDDLTGDSDPNHTAVGREYAAETVKALRLGNAVHGVPARPKMAVRGLLINSNATSAMNQVFGPGTYSTADNFGEDLEKELNAILEAIDNDIECKMVEVVPQINLTVDKTAVSVVENGDTKFVKITISNPGEVDLKDVKLVIEGLNAYSPSGFEDFRLPKGSEVEYTLAVSLPLGGKLPDAFKVRVQGTADLSSTQIIKPGASENVTDGPIEIDVSYTRVPLPA